VNGVIVSGTNKADLQQKIEQTIADYLKSFEPDKD
jgi:hypothetical protein